MAKGETDATDTENADVDANKVQSLGRHQNQRYYVRTFAGGKEKWTSFKTTLLSVSGTG